VEHIGTVLERASVLSGVESELEGLSILSDDLILLDGGVGSVGGPVNES